MASSRDAGHGKLIVCAGMAVIDHVYRVASFPAPGTKNRADDFFSVLGGCAANAAIAIHRLGGRARVVAPLGGPAVRDMTGDNILAQLARETIDVAHLVRVDGAVSSESSILIDSSGERLIVSYRDPALEHARPRDPQGAIAGADAVLIDNRFPEFVLPIARAAAAEGKIVVLDGDKPTRLTDDLLTAATHIVFSADGLRATANQDDLAAALGLVAERTDAFLAVTDGPRDMLWLDHGSVLSLPAFRVDAVDTLAAGDVFHGAFALALVEGRQVTAAMRFAAATAAIKCSRSGGGAGAPDRVGVELFLLNRSEK
jgi:sugar/nucleoside kinase (ribokinase family)